MKYDLTIAGGGTSGIAAAYIAAKYGLKTLLTEKSDVLGGSVTQGLVIPVMKTDSSNINVEFYSDLLKFADKYNARHTYIDGNAGWFNPELLKVVFDDMLQSVNCDLLFSSEIVDISFSDIFSILIEHKLLSLHIETNYIVDATGIGKIFKILNHNFQKKSEKKQTPTLRFMMSGIDLKKFSDMLEKIDNNKNVTTIERAECIHLSTAYTSDENTDWALKPIFKEAVANGDLKADDCAYFQVFTVVSMPDSLAFNCPRVFPDGDIDNPFVYSKALVQARARIIRLSEFCRKYFPGFENAYISHIADMFGIREYSRIKGKYTLSAKDIINSKEFKNIAFTSNYPIDIHSADKGGDKLIFTPHTYSVPVEALICEENDKLYATGKIISAEFEAQAAVRTQANCFSMGEAVAKDILKRTKKV